MKWMWIAIASAFLASCAAVTITPIPPPNAFPDIENYQSVSSLQEQEKWKRSGSSGAVVYPKQLLAKGVQGWVVISYSIEPDGSTSNIKIIDSSPSGDDGFEATSINHISSLRFEPVDQKLTGQRVSGVVEILQFRMQQ